MDEIPPDDQVQIWLDLFTQRLGLYIYVIEYLTFHHETVV